MKKITKKNIKPYLRHLLQQINSKAFTTFELLLVIALVTIIGATSIPFLSRFITQNATGDTYSRLLAEFRKAQTYAMLGKQNSPWGVYYGVLTDRSRLSSMKELPMPSLVEKRPLMNRMSLVLMFQ